MAFHRNSAFKKNPYELLKILVLTELAIFGDSSDSVCTV